MPRQRWGEQEERSASHASSTSSGGLDYTRRRWRENNNNETSQTAVGKKRDHATNMASTMTLSDIIDGKFTKKKMTIDDLVIGTCAYDAIVKKITYSKQKQFSKTEHVNSAHLHIIGLEEQANIRTNIILGRKRMTPYYQRNIRTGSKICIRIFSKNDKHICASMDGIDMEEATTAVDEEAKNASAKLPQLRLEEVKHSFFNDNKNNSMNPRSDDGGKQQPSARKKIVHPYGGRGRRCCVDFAIDRNSCSGCRWDHSDIILNSFEIYIGIVVSSRNGRCFVNFGFSKDGFIPYHTDVVSGNVVQVAITSYRYEHQRPLIDLKLIKILHDSNWKDYHDRLPMIVQENEDNNMLLSEKIHPIAVRRWKSDEGEYNSGSNSGNNKAFASSTTTTTTTNTSNFANNDNNSNKKRKFSDDANEYNSTEEQRKKQKTIAGDDGKMVNKVVNESSNNNITIGSRNGNNNIQNMMMEYDNNHQAVYDPANEMSVFDQEVELESQKLQNQNITVESLFAEREIHLQEIKAYRLRVEDLMLENERQEEKYKELKSNYDNLAGKLKHRREQLDKEKIYRKSKQKKLEDAKKTIYSLEGQLKTYKEINGVFNRRATTPVYREEEEEVYDTKKSSNSSSNDQ